MSLQEFAQVKTHQELTPGHYLLTLRAPRITEAAQPGQFVHVKCSPTLDPLLRRPISLHYINKAAGTIDLLYHVVGRGTKLLARTKEGETLDIMGPLGNGFTLPEKTGHILVVGGGIGSAPLLPLVEALMEKGHRVTAVIGARSENYLLGTDQLAGLGAEVLLATDDGSRGQRGLVTDLMERVIDQGKIDFAYICGPNPMMRAASGILKTAGIPGEVSLEERMGCGVGACLACVCKTQSSVVSGHSSASGSASQASCCGGGQPGGFDYQKVCVDGPVFALEEVVWDE